MRPGNHAAGDGSFGRSAGTNAGKAIALVAIAVLIGAVLLRHNGGVQVSATGTKSTTTKKPAATAAPTTPGSVITTPTTVGVRSPSSVKVLVANGTTAPGAATRYAAKLHGLGYNTLAPIDTTVLGVKSTSVYYAPSYQQEAALIAQQIAAPASAVQPMPAQLPVRTINGANILVVLGQDLTGAGGTTATTSRTATTRAATSTTAKG